MEISLATIQIAMLAIPGLVWALITSSTIHSSKSVGPQYWASVFIFGVLCYAILAIFYRIFGIDFDAFDFGTTSPTSLASKADEIIWSIPISLALTCAWLTIKTYSLVPRLLRRARISDHSGCDDIWEYALGNASPVGKWVNIRDFQNQLVYEGWVKAYSDGPLVREALLAHASVYDFDSNKLYDQHAIYLSRPIDCVNLEFVELENA